MLKRLSASAILAALVIPLLLAVAFAGYGLKMEQLQTIDQRAAQNPSDWDSLISTSGSGQHFDTTAWVPTSIFKVPQSQTVALDVDSFYVTTLMVTPKPGSTVAVTADTVYATVQGSLDGVNPLTLNGRGSAAEVMLENGTSNTFHLVLYQASTTAGIIGPGVIAAGGTTFSTAQILGIPNVRFIIQGDQTGEYQYFIRRWSEVPGEDKP